MLCLLGPTPALAGKSIDWPIDHSAKRRVIAPRPARSRYAELGANGGVGDYVTKPKGMHWRTFERAMERIDRAEGNRPLQYARLQRNPRC